MGSYGKVGYLTGIVRSHINRLQTMTGPPQTARGGTDSTTLDGLSCSPPPVQLQWGRVYYSGSSPLHYARYVINTYCPSIGLELILKSHFVTSIVIYYYITNTTTCQVVH